MANVSDVIFCLRATNIEGQGACATTILTALTPEYIPGLFTFSVIITLLDIDSSSGHQLMVDFVSPADENVVHVDGSIDPLRDIETINLELIFSDLEILERRTAKTTKVCPYG